MGLRGPAPKPTVIEIAQGRPGKRPINQLEPQPGVITPHEAIRSCPKRLGKEERRWWRYYAPILAGIRVLTEADLIALEKLAKATAERVKYERQLDEAGPLYRTKSGYVQVSPLYSVVSGLRETELKLLREFGMTPSSRTRVNTVGSKPGADPLAEALFG